MPVDLLKFLGRMIGLLLRFIWRILPYALRLAWELIKIMMVTLIANFRGWQSTANELADRWTDQIIRDKRLPINSDKYLRPVLFVCAYLIMITGWILLSYLTVFIVKLIF